MDKEPPQFICEICSGSHPTEAHIPHREIVQEIPYPKLWTPELLKEVAEKEAELDREHLDTPFVNLDLSQEGFGHVLIKDESVNPTGTHKDRLALAIAEQFVYETKMFKYSVLQNDPETWKRRSDNLRDNSINRFSLITSGHGGMALATMFKKHELPPPKLLLDTHTDPDIIEQLKKQNTDIYLIDLGMATLTTKDVLELTNNQLGSDLTSQNLDYDGYWRVYYQKLAEELFEQKPDQIYVPNGSGNLFEGILSAQTIDYTAGHGLHKKGKTINDIDVFGAEPETADTKAVMLYAPSKPFKYFDLKGIHKNTMGTDGPGVFTVSETGIEQAYQIYQKHHIQAGYSSATAMALYLKRFREGKVSEKDKVIIVNTGRGIVKKDW